MFNMTDNEKTIFLEALEQAKKDKTEIIQPRQVREIVPIEKWLENEYYVGPDGARLYDYWKEVLAELFNPNNNYSECILSGSIGCLNEDTKVPTSLGLLSLKELDEEWKKGNKFQVLSEDGWRECKFTHNEGLRPTKVIEFSNGTKVEGTLKHRIRVIRDGNYEWVKFKDLKLGDMVCMTRKQSPFGSLDISEYAYTLGYMIGDGGITSDNNIYRVPYLLYQKNCELENDLKEGFEALFGYYKDSDSKKSNLWQLRASNEIVCSELLSEGFGLGSENKGVPLRVRKSNRDSVALFLKGLFDADGTVNKSDIELVVKSHKLTKDVASLLSMFGISYRLRDKYDKKYKAYYSKLTITSKESFIIFRDFIGFGLKYKSDRLDQLCKETRFNNRVIIPYGNQVLNHLMNINKIKRYSKHRSLFGWYNNHQEVTKVVLEDLYKLYPDWIRKSDYLMKVLEHRSYFVEIVSISDSECYTRDLSIEGSPSYCFNGFISHNTGKSTCALFGTIRKLYELSCYENISGLFDLMRTSMIAFFYLSLSRSQAELTGFGQMKELIDSIPYFKEHFPRNERVGSMLVFPERTLILHGSESNHFIGTNMIGCILDEANFHQGETTDANKGSMLELSKVSNLYASMTARARSRFMKNGKNNSLCFLVSSATHASSFTEKRIEAAKNDPSHSTLVRSPKLWEVKPIGTYSSKNFYLFTGNSSLDPFVIENSNDLSSIKESLQMTISPNTSFGKDLKDIQTLHPDVIVPVPEDFRIDFDNNLYKAMQDIAGVSTAPNGVLFSSMPTYLKNIDETLEHPFTKESFTISTRSSLRVEDFLKPGFRFKDPEKPRYVHIDQSKTTDCTGLAMVHLDSMKEDEAGYKHPIVVVDFKLRIEPPRKPLQISITKVRQFMNYLRDYMGLNIALITYDQFASDEARQLLEEDGFNVSYQSVDRTDAAYLQACSLYYEGRLKDYRYSPFEDEWFYLQHYRDKRKVDHLPGKAKDVSDGFVGAINNCLNNLQDNYESTYSDYNDYDEYEDTITIHDLVPELDNVIDVRRGIYE